MDTRGKVVLKGEKLPGGRSNKMKTRRKIARGRSNKMKTRRKLDTTYRIN
jgi:hypothetical protein